MVQCVWSECPKNWLKIERSIKTTSQSHELRIQRPRNTLFSILPSKKEKVLLPFFRLQFTFCPYVRIVDYAIISSKYCMNVCDFIDDIHFVAKRTVSFLSSVRSSLTCLHSFYNVSQLWARAIALTFVERERKNEILGQKLVTAKKKQISCWNCPLLRWNGSRNKRKYEWISRSISKH